MLLEIPNVLTAEQVAQCRRAMEQAEWVDGRVTAGPQSALAKDNQQLPEDHPVARQMGDLILEALQGDALFMAAALPLRVFPHFSTATGRGNRLVRMWTTRYASQRGLGIESARTFRRRCSSRIPRSMTEASWLSRTHTAPIA